MKEAAGGEEVIFASHHKAASKLFCGLLGFPRAQWLPKKLLFRLLSPEGHPHNRIVPVLSPHRFSTSYRWPAIVVPQTHRGQSLAGFYTARRREKSAQKAPAGTHEPARGRKSVTPAFIHHARHRALARGRPCPGTCAARGEREKRRGEGRGRDSVAGSPLERPQAPRPPQERARRRHHSETISAGSLARRRLRVSPYYYP